MLAMVGNILDFFDYSMDLNLNLELGREKVLGFRLGFLPSVSLWPSFLFSSLCLDSRVLSLEELCVSNPILLGFM